MNFKLSRTSITKKTMKTKIMPKSHLGINQLIEDIAGQYSGDNVETPITYTPAQWKARGEQYGLKSECIIIHDGGEYGPFFDLDCGHYEAHDFMQNELSKHGLYFETCTTWYSAIYKND
tara:strand:+ start:2840 stop:3196 length:357 start_codon:yes stop_codon:yes gene_type:complete